MLKSIFTKQERMDIINQLIYDTTKYSLFSFTKYLPKIIKKRVTNTLITLIFTLLPR